MSELGDCLITGGAGFFGTGLVAALLKRPDVGRIVVFSRDELKHHALRQRYPDTPGAQMRYFVGDVRDVSRLRRAFRGIDTVVHCAALKQVPSCEYNPLEAVQTNVLGACHVVEAALDCGVSRVLGLSSDKCVAAINLYGATKAVMEKIFIQANAYAGHDDTRFACVRWGNVAGSSGSVLPLFMEQRTSGAVRLTDRRMTRFWIDVSTAVQFALWCLAHMRGGEVFVPKMASACMVDIAAAIAPDCAIEETGIRPGEKLHEALIAPDEVRQTLDVGEGYVIQPAHPWWTVEGWESAVPVPAEFRYTSDNPALLSAVQWEERT